MPSDGHTGAHISSDGLTIEFAWRVDRFDHVVRGLGVRIATADSTELATPVFQEVHQQGDVAFASGMDADRHWSASVEAIRGGLLFDVACRLKSAAAIGSAYQAWDVKRVPLIGKPADGVAAPTVATEGGVLVIRSAQTAEGSPATLRYRFAIVAADGGWIERDA